MDEPKLRAWQFGTRKSEWSLGRHIYFEARALLGRFLSPRRRTARFPLLQLGSGPTPLPHFENVDFYFQRRGEVRHVGHDLRAPLPYDDETFEGVYSEHTLEHLYPAAALRLIADVHRVLKPGGVFRCSVPNLGRYVEFYSGAVPHEGFREKFSSGCEAIWNLTQNDLHRSVWDAELLKQKMLESGFSSAEERSYRSGGDPRLLVDLEWRAWESLYVEGVK